MQKQCTKCFKIKEIKQFHKNWKERYRPKCKECETNKIEFWIWKCQYCKNDFQIKTYQQKFCNWKCRTKSKLKYPNWIIRVKKQKPQLQLKKCRDCGIEFKPYTSLDKFCTYECRNNFKKQQRSRNWNLESCEKRKWKNNPAYKHWMRIKEKNIKTSRLFQKNCKILDNKLINTRWYIYCEECDTTNTMRFEHHHIIYRSEKPSHEHLHNINNIILLCIGCHNEYHKHKSKRNKIVEKRKLNILFWNDILDK